MAKLNLDIVTAERIVYSESDVDEIVAPGTQGEFAVLPRHAAFMTTLMPGVLLIRKGDDEVEMAITGGFVEVRDDRVVVLADAAERAEDIDEARATEARRRAEERLASRDEAFDDARTRASLLRSLARIKALERRRRRRGGSARG